MKQIKHFVPNKNSFGDGIPVCNCFSEEYAFNNEIAKTRKDVTCKNCRKTRIFRKLK